MTALFDFSSLLVVLLLLICTFAYLRAWTLKRGPDGELQSWLEAGGKHKGGLWGCAWKMARVGERLSPYIAVSLVIMVRFDGTAPLGFFCSRVFSSVVNTCMGSTLQGLLAYAAEFFQRLKSNLRLHTRPPAQALHLVFIR